MITFHLCDQLNNKLQKLMKNFRKRQKVIHELMSKALQNAEEGDEDLLNLQPALTASSPDDKNEVNHT